MTDDILSRATRALREESTPSFDDLAETRARLLTSSHVGQARKLRALRWVLPLAAAFAAGTAFAATGTLDMVVRSVRDLVVESSEQVAEAKEARRVAKPKPKKSTPAQSEPSAAPQLEAMPDAWAAAAEPAAATALPAQEPAVGVVEAPPPQTKRAARPRLRTQRTAEVSQPAALAPEPVAAPEAVRPIEAVPEALPSPDLAAYRTAHRAHFKGHDDGAALALWDSYLSRFPRGMFAVEARYNRALCLLRLGRREEAARALSPFAQGYVAAGYRRAEAQALLEALQHP